MKDLGRFLRIGTAALAIEGMAVGAFAISPSAIPQSVSQQEQGASDLDFSILEENLQALVGETVTISGWPEFVNMEYIRPVGSTDVPIAVDIYRLLEEPGKKSPLYFFDPQKMARGGSQIARERYKNMKVTLKGKIAEDIYGLGVGAFLQISGEPTPLTAIPPFNVQE